MTRKKCPYCTFDPETHMGADFITGKPIDRNFEEKIESWDGMNWEYATYIYFYAGLFHLETDFPDNECYERTYTHTVIEYCPKCGRNLRDEKDRKSVV